MKHLRLSSWVPVSMALALAAGAPGSGQDAGFDDEFAENPLLHGWVFNVSAFWVPPNARECVNMFGEPDPNSANSANPCTVYSPRRLGDLGIDPVEFGGYVQLTPGRNGENGNVFRSERHFFDSFRLEAVFEMRDGTSLGRPGDGMCLVIVGGENPPSIIGVGGGGMGAPCVGDDPSDPIIVFEFDNTSCNASDQTNDNHLGFCYGPNGIPCTDNVPTLPRDGFNGVFFPFPAPRWHNQLQPNLAGLEQAPANRFRLTVYAQLCGETLTVAADLNALDAGVDLGRIFTHVVEGYVPFAGYLGATASTGGWNQSHILHSAALELLPDDFCLAPAANADRTVHPSTGGAEFACGDFRDGDEVRVEVRLRDIRAADECCAAATSVTVRDEVPGGWAVVSAEWNGRIADGGAAVEWVLDGADLADGAMLAYTASAADNGVDTFYGFSGAVTENVRSAVPVRIEGDTRVRLDTPFDDCGGLVCWNTLGPYLQPGTQNASDPGVANIRRDYMTDGDETELDFTWFPGAALDTEYGPRGAAWASGLHITGQPQVNPGGVPTVYPWNDTDGFINLNDDVYRRDPNRCMSYAQIYAINDTGADMSVRFGVSSDDSVQVLVNGEEVWIHSVSRTGRDACNPQDLVPDGVARVAPVVLRPGENSILVKTFTGDGSFSFALRITDDAGAPIEDGLELAKFPAAACPLPPFDAVREIDTGATLSIQGEEVPSYAPGQSYRASIRISNVRRAGDLPACPGAPPRVLLRETVPAGWRIAGAEGGGRVDGRTITWDLEGGALVEQDLRYWVDVPTDADGDVAFLGEYEEPRSILTFRVGGNGRFARPLDLTAEGFFRKWLLLGPYQQPVGFGFGAAPSIFNMQADWLTDGNVSQFRIEPRPGDQILSDFDRSPATGLAAALGAAAARVNPGGVPTWAEWTDTDDTIDFDDYYGGDLNSILMHSFTYVLVEADMIVDIGLASDDSVEVILDGMSIHTNSVPRSHGGPNAVQDVIRDVRLTQGIHRLLVKVFEGGGDHGFRLRFQDETGAPITAGIRLCFYPTADECREIGPPDSGFLRGDADGNRALELTDAVYVFNWLFLGGPEPGCLEAADASDQGAVNLTSGVYILNYLFRGGPPPPHPFPRCGGGKEAFDLECRFQGCG